MTIPIRLVFEGSVCRESLQTAVAEAARSHPLLTSCVRCDHDSLSIYEAPPTDLTWVSSDLTPEIRSLRLDDSGLPVGLDPQSDRIDLSREIGFKTFVAEQNGKTEIHFLIHHAACDGLGSFKFVEEVLARYHAAQTRTKPPTPVVDSESLKLRNSKSETSLPWYRRMIRSSFVLPRRILGMTGQTPAKIAATTPDSKTVANQPASGALEMPTLTLSKQETTDVSRYAKTHQGTTNELLLNQLFKVLSEWNQKSIAAESGQLRVIVPFSLRNRSHQTMSAANCVSMVYVDGGKLADDADSLADISKQLKYIRKWQIEYSWNQTASLAFRSKRIAALIRKQAGRHLCTTVLSNLGRPFKHSVLPLQEDGRIQAGDLTLQSAHIAAPTTANTIATFAALFYAGRLTLTMNYNKTKMSRADAQALMELWGKSLSGFGQSPVTAKN